MSYEKTNLSYIPILSGSYTSFTFYLTSAIDNSPIVINDPYQFLLNLKFINEK